MIDHYETALERIRTRGFFATVSETSGPYIEAVWQNFSSDRDTITQGLLSGRYAGHAWTAFRRLLGAAPADSASKTA